jgi:inner membrane transporter RhtA
MTAVAQEAADGADAAGATDAPSSDPAATALVLGGVLSLQGGSTVARDLIPIAGVAGTVALRATLGAAMLALRRRPALPADRGKLGFLAAVGLVLAVQHLAFYASIDRLPLGVAVTIEFFSGPLALAVVKSRRPGHVLWVLVAAAGVLLASDATSGARLEVAGVLLALVGGVTWAMYIVMFPRAGDPGDRAGALTTATLVAALVTLPYGIAVDHATMFSLHALWLGAIVALLADVIAYSLQAHALSRVPARTYSLLVSTQPAVAALLGWIALSQSIGPAQWVGVAAVVAASAASRV